MRQIQQRKSGDLNGARKRWSVDLLFCPSEAGLLAGEDDDQAESDQDVHTSGATGGW